MKITIFIFMGSITNDIYTRNDSISTYDPNAIEIHDELTLLKEKIECCLFTRKGEIIGEPDFGCNIEELVFSLNQNEQTIEDKIQAQLIKYCSTPGYRISVNVKFYVMPNDYSNGCVIEVLINDTRAIVLIV
ncbi:MAG: hypothetical protein EOM74_00845 [Methanomicrobia archaeon]|nr:hypothetical protein [Methanomicrobia archaeon]